MIQIIIGIVVVIFFLGIRIVRPTTRGLVERLGRYHRFANPGFHWVVPVVERMVKVNITEQMVDAQPQEIIVIGDLAGVLPLRRSRAGRDAEGDEGGAKRREGERGRGRGYSGGERM